MTFFSRIPVSSQLLQLSETVAYRCSPSARNDQRRVTMSSFRHLFKSIRNLNMRSFSASDNTPETQFRYAYISLRLHELRQEHHLHPQKLAKVEKIQLAFDKVMSGDEHKCPAERAGAPVTHYLKRLREGARVNFAAEFEAIRRTEMTLQRGQAHFGASSRYSS